jgi:hypothetical protein
MFLLPASVANQRKGSSWRAPDEHKSDPAPLCGVERWVFELLDLGCV